ncbi:MAG: hypothetical protein DLM68_11455 [Hyphomicrobiales bacterium]|nr:MAG: hypothetical protein DLM68_11455 [Hyphomicrobiales bacterium]
MCLRWPDQRRKVSRYVEQVLVPTLSPGEIGMMDTSPPARGVRRAPLGSHKCAGVRKAIEATAATQGFLPAYSPDLDPIDPSAMGRAARMRHHRRWMQLMELPHDPC